MSEFGTRTNKSGRKTKKLKKKMRSGFQFADRTFEHQMDHLCDTSLLNMVDEPLSTLPDERLRPSRESLDKVMAAF